MNSLTYSLILTYSLAARHGNSTASTSHRSDGELNRLAAEMGCKGSEQGGNAPAFGKTVQARARLPLFLFSNQPM